MIGLDVQISLSVKQVIPEYSNVQLTMEDLYLRCINCLVFGSVGEHTASFIRLSSEMLWRVQWYITLLKNILREHYIYKFYAAPFYEVTSL